MTLKKSTKKIKIGPSYCYLYRMRRTLNMMERHIAKLRIVLDKPSRVAYDSAIDRNLRTLKSVYSKLKMEFKGRPKKKPRKYVKSQTI